MVDLVDAPRRDRVQVVLRSAVAAWVLWLLWRTLLVGHEQVVVELHHYQLFDWLISYEGGFVRRGLAGELATLGSRALEVSRAEVVLAVQAASYATLAASVLWLVRRVVLTPALVLLLFAPFLFPFPVLSTDAGFRKEVLAFAVMGVVAAGVASARSDVVRYRFLLGGVVAFVPVVLTHELLVVLLPGLAVLGTRVAWDRRRARAVGLAVGAVVVAVVASFLAPGSDAQVAAICADLRASLPDTAPLDRCDHRSAVDWLRLGAGDGVASLQRVWPRLGPSFAIAFPLVLLGVLPAVVETARSLDRRTRRVWAIGALAGIAINLPVFAIAIDWGRFVYLHAVTATLAVLALRHARPAPALPRWASVGILAGLPAYAVGWHLKHTGNVFLGGWWDRLTG